MQLHMCWADIENDGDIVGHLLRWDGTSMPSFAKGVLDARDPFDDPECVDCYFLPSCFGSCPKSRLVNRSNGAKQCPPAKWTMPHWVRGRYGSEDKLRKRVLDLDQVFAPSRAVAS